MCRIVFECVGSDGEMFSVSIESDSECVTDTVTDMAALYRRRGIEVISATRIEEMPVDLNLYVPAPRRAPAPRSVSRALFSRLRPVWLLEKGAVATGLILSILGFDDGFSVASIASHVEKFVPAMERVIQHIV